MIEVEIRDGDKKVLRKKLKESGIEDLLDKLLSVAKDASEIDEKIVEELDRCRDMNIEMNEVFENITDVALPRNKECLRAQYACMMELTSVGRKHLAKLKKLKEKYEDFEDDDNDEEDDD